ncbi:hypothetical protein YB2330_002585 [Saitoella coloradoensis]
MPKAEVGTPKYLANKMKSRGLQRLRWYCQACERQMRDENGFKCHTQTEAHVRQMILIGENPQKYIQDFSQQFQSDFIQLLRTAHGEKRVNINHFYQEYIGNKEHVHMNSTRWKTLTEFAKHLGREGICRVDETEKGFHVAWIDNSPEALRRQAVIQKRDRQERGDEDREQKLLKEQIEKAQKEADEKGRKEEDQARELQRSADDAPITLALTPKVPSPPANDEQTPITPGDKPALTGGFVMKPLMKKNVFAAAKKANPLAAKKTDAKPAVSKKPLSAAEQIIQEEKERKERMARGGFGGDRDAKRLRY